jgi:hypothetical protein
VSVVVVSDEKGGVADAKLLAAAERVHLQLRPHLAGRYAQRMREVIAAGAEMAVAVEGGEVAGVAVYRMVERTFSGRELYCDDLVTDETRRSTGVGHASWSTCGPSAPGAAAMPSPWIPACSATRPTSSTTARA